MAHVEFIGPIQNTKAKAPKKGASAIPIHVPPVTVSNYIVQWNVHQVGFEHYSI